MTKDDNDKYNYNKQESSHLLPSSLLHYPPCPAPLKRQVSTGESKGRDRGKQGGGARQSPEFLKPGDMRTHVPTKFSLACAKLCCVACS